jgi:hypothetical protein
VDHRRSSATVSSLASSCGLRIAYMRVSWPPSTTKAIAVSNAPTASSSRGDRPVEQRRGGLHVVRQLREGRSA